MFNQSTCSFYGKATNLIITRFSDRDFGSSSSIVDTGLYDNYSWSKHNKRTN